MKVKITTTSNKVFTKEIETEMRETFDGCFYTTLRHETWFKPIGFKSNSTFNTWSPSLKSLVEKLKNFYLYKDAEIIFE